MIAEEDLTPRIVRGIASAVLRCVIVDAINQDVSDPAQKLKERALYYLERDDYDLRFWCSVFGVESKKVRDLVLGVNSGTIQRQVLTKFLLT